jgi:DNA invertase Pin-like site-specific DNA recombinase
MLIGYARTSTVDQVAGLEAQEVALAATGCQKLFSEQASSVAQRDQLAAALDFVREGDTLIVTRLDRLARSTADLLGVVATLEAKKVVLHAQGLGASAIAAEIGISRASVYRVLSQARDLAPDAVQKTHTRSIFLHSPYVAVGRRGSYMFAEDRLAALPRTSLRRASISTVSFAARNGTLCAVRFGA